jgi:hypothetical protein
VFAVEDLHEPVHALADALAVDDRTSNNTPIPISQLTKA